MLGFRGSRKGTPFAAQQASLTAANKAKEAGMRAVEVKVAVRGQAVSRPCARYLRSALRFDPSATSRRFRIMDARRRNAAASDSRCFQPGWRQPGIGVPRYLHAQQQIGRRLKQTAPLLNAVPRAVKLTDQILGIVSKLHGLGL